jgi:hypothetical protein
MWSAVGGIGTSESCGNAWRMLPYRAQFDGRNQLCHVRGVSGGNGKVFSARCVGVGVADQRHLAVEYFLKALCTGERSAVERLAPLLGDDVTYETNSQPGVAPVGRDHFAGREAVLARVSGDWPATPAYRHLGWSEPVEVGNGLLATSSETVTLAFRFNDARQISHVRLEGGWGSGVALEPEVGGSVDEIPLVIRGLINGALLNQTPLVVTYSDKAGAPRSTWRGSVSVIGPTDLGIWIRNPEGDFARALEGRPAISLMYSDFRTWHMVNIAGIARHETDSDIRRMVYERSPEREQLHDLERGGVAAVVDVTTLQAFSAGVVYRLDRTAI